VCDPVDGRCSSPPSPDGTPCDDENACTTGDVCGAGTCAGGGAAPPCGPCLACAPSGGCVPTPAAQCRKPTGSGKARVTIKSTSSERDSLAWKWTGAATSKEDLGTPTSTSDYALCVYDRQGGAPRLLLSALAPAGGDCTGRPCWREASTGFRYNDRALTPDGLLKLLLRAGGDGKAKIALRGKGTNLGPEPVPYAGTVTVQLQRLDEPAICWDADYSAAAANGSGRYSARSD
jgi:hypothetical protein